jgi:hypothetical protein
VAQGRRRKPTRKGNGKDFMQRWSLACDGHITMRAGDGCRQSKSPRPSTSRPPSPWRHRPAPNAIGAASYYPGKGAATATILCLNGNCRRAAAQGTPCPARGFESWNCGANRKGPASLRAACSLAPRPASSTNPRKLLA